MKPIHFLPILFLLLLLAPSSGNAAGSMLRISCDGDDVGAEVLVNGKFRGECPIDLQVPEGSLKLLVRKKVGGGRERMFEQDIRMGEGSVKKVEAHLGAAMMSAGEKARKTEKSQRLGKMPFDAVQKEATAGDTDAMFSLTVKYALGSDGAPKNKELYMKWLHNAAEAGNVEAMDMLWLELSLGDDMVQSRIWQRKAAEAGSVEAMLKIADAYNDGLSELPRDYSEALRWYRRTAELGDPNGELEVGNFYYYGKGVPKSNEEAVAWWRKAADAGGSDDKVGIVGKDAMYRLGRSYAKGEGVAASEEQAIKWWRKAAEGKYPNSSAVKELKKRGLR